MFLLIELSGICVPLLYDAYILYVRIDVLTNFKCQNEELLHEIHHVNLLPTSTSFNITNNSMLSSSIFLIFVMKTR